MLRTDYFNTAVAFINSTSLLSHGFDTDDSRGVVTISEIKYSCLNLPTKSFQCMLCSAARLQC